MKESVKIPHYDYDKVLKQIQHASYPASLGSINLILYQFMKTGTKQTFGSPALFFLIASVLFFFISILIGLGIGIAQKEPVFSVREIQELKYRQAFGIVLAFSIAIIFDLLGLIFLISLQIGS